MHDARMHIPQIEIREVFRSSCEHHVQSGRCGFALIMCRVTELALCILHLHRAF